ncbi:MAG: hypothetical protein LCH63_14665 [Candidatus Melainabacteria bacterium]|nr:hypothetical protein [Candidatus Melainabacteria bacterium]
MQEENEQLVQELHKRIQGLRGRLEEMYQDDRYSTDDKFLRATENLNSYVNELSKKLREANSEFLNSKISELKTINDNLRVQSDRLDGLIKGAKQGTELLAAVEQLGKIIHPLF